MIAIDYETHLISNGNIFPKPVCLSGYDGKDTFLLDSKVSEQKLHEILTKKELIIAHNAVFECGVTVTHYPDLKDLVFDALDNELIYCTKINEEIWNIQREKRLMKLTLADLVQHYFDEDISGTKTDPNAWRLRYSELDGIPIAEWPVEASSYAIDDSIWAYKVYQKQERIGQSLALKSAVYLNLMGSKGFLVDRSRSKLLEDEIWAFLQPRYDFLVNEGFCDYIAKQKQPRKQTKKLKEYVQSLEVDHRYTDKGNVSLDAESLEIYRGQIEDPILTAFADIAKYEKVLTSYLNHLDTNIIYTQYSTTKSTGRTSSSSSKLFDSLNIQQMPRKVEGVTYDVRNCFIPRPGKVICSIDYSGLELCSAAHQLYKTLGYSYMRAALNEGDKPTDMHSKLAARIKGMDFNEFMERKAEFKDERQKAKPINLGLPGGIGYDTMRHQMWRDGIKTKYQILEKSKSKRSLQYYLTNLHCPDLRIKQIGPKEYALVQDELVILKRYLFDLYPELEQFLKEEHKKYLTGKTRWKKNDFGEWEEDPVYSYDIYGFKRDWCNYTAFCNGFLMQTPAAIGATSAVNRSMRTFWNSPDITPLAFIHDEILFEVTPNRTDLVEEASYIMIEEMQKILSSVRISVEASLSDYWQKADGFYTKTSWLDPK
jgi:hypothetical protein